MTRYNHPFEPLGIAPSELIARDTVSGESEIIDQLMYGPALQREFPRMQEIPQCVNHANKKLNPKGWKIVWRWVHVPTKFGRIKERLYQLERI